MSMLDELDREIARRELALIDEEIARKEKSLTGTPEIIEEMHPEVSAIDRLRLKNLSQSPEKSAEFLKKSNPQLDTRVWDGRVLVKGKNESQWRALDPDAEGFDGLGEFAMDVGDIGYDVLSGIGEGLATAGGAVTGFLGGAGVGALPAAMLASGAASAGSEAIRQKLGQLAGIDQEVDTGDVLTAGAIGGLLPGVPSALKKGAGMAKGAAKGTAKFLGGLDDKAIAGMTREGEEAIAKMEEETVVPTLEKISDMMGKEFSELDLAKASRANKIKSQLNISNDDQVREVLTNRSQDLKLAGKHTEANSIDNMIKELDETVEIRRAIDNVGVEDIDVLKKEAFPDIKSPDELIQELPEEAGDLLRKELELIQENYSNLKFGSEGVDTSKVKEIYDRAIVKYEAMGGESAQKIAKALKKDFNSKFMIKNPDYNPSAQTRVDTTGYLMGDTKYAKDRIKITKKDGKLVSRYAPDKSTDFTSKKIFEKVMPYEKAEFTKNQLSQAYNNAKKDLGIGKGVQQAKSIVKYQQQAERALNDAMDEAAKGGKKELDPLYVEMGNVLDIQKKRFGDENKVRSTIEAILRGGNRAKQYMREIKRIDNVLENNHFSSMMEEAVRVDKLAKKGSAQAKQFEKAGDIFAEKEALEQTSVKGQLYNKLKDYFQDGDKVTPKKTFKALNDYANINDPNLNKNIDDLAKEYGDDVAKEFKDVVDDIGLAAIFGDSEKTLIKNAGKEETSNVGRGALQGITWQTGLGAGGAQVGGAIGKAIGAKVPIRKALRKTLPTYFEKKKTLKELSGKAKDELEKKMIGSIMSRRDVIRELSKQLAQEKRGD